ncbi:hypothetical protein SK128_005963 [Halocaridina rubra]|uniref:Reelin n=1 Tax=Halocaridina rubra TaxID=373956 RepID=A0AAN8ZYQ9_HALRR
MSFVSNISISCIVDLDIIRSSYFRQEAFFIPLPISARTRQTRFRWWQGYNEMLLGDDANSQGEHAEWHLDNVMVLANETLPQALLDTFDGNTSVSLPWFLTSGSSLLKGCGKNDSVMMFPGYSGFKYAETWDFVAAETNLIQFDIRVGCDDTDLGGEVDLEYSNDHGMNWLLSRSG